MKINLDREIDENVAVISKIKSQSDLIHSIGIAASKIIRNGGKIILFGNGGSAADAQHIAAELVGKFQTVEKALHAIALTTNTSILTAIGNDFSFDQVFSRQIDAIATSKDFVIGITTSGRSMNVIRALQSAKEKGAITCALTGGDGGKIIEVADSSVIIPSTSTQRIQEGHILVGHLICLVIKTECSN